MKIKGFGLVGVLLIIGVLITAGKVMLQKKISPTPIPSVQAPPLTKTDVSSLSIFSPSEVVSEKDTLRGKIISVRGYARRAVGPCTGTYTLDCSHCPGSIVLSETQEGKLGSLDTIYGCHYPTEEYDRAIWLLKESQGLLSFNCLGSGTKPDCTYQCPNWELGAFYQVIGTWRQDNWGRYFLEMINKQKL